jgi:hypothetical protein
MTPHRELWTGPVSLADLRNDPGIKQALERVIATGGYVPASERFGVKRYANGC